MLLICLAALADPLLARQEPRVFAAPSDSVRQYEVALGHFQNGDTGSALSVLEALTISHPKFQEAWILLSAIHLQSGNPDAARSSANAGLELFPASAGLRQILAELHLARGDTEAGLRGYIDLEPDARSDAGMTVQQRREILDRLAELYLLTGLRDVESGRIERSENRFAEVIRLQPDSVYGYQNLAVSAYRGGRFEEAVAILDRGLNRMPFSVPLLRIKAAAQSGLQDYEGLEQTYSLLHTLEPDDAGIATGRLEVLLINRKFDEAGELVESSIRRNPGDARLYNELSEAYARTGYLVGAVGVLQRKLIRFPGNRPAMLQKAIYLEQLGEYEEAGRVYRSLSDNGGQDVEGGLGLARMYTRIDSLDAAREVWQRLADAFPSNEEILWEASQFFLEQDGSGRGIAMLERLNRMQPGPVYRFELARAIDRAGEPGRALELYASAVDDGFFHPLAFYRLASSGKAIEGAGEGCELLRRTLDLTLVRLNTLQRQALASLGADGYEATDPRRQPGEPGLAESDSLAMLTYDTIADDCDADFLHGVVHDLLDRYGDSGNIRLMAARFFEKMGAAERALEQAALAATLNPRNYDIQLMLARLAEEANQAERALASYERARQLRPGETAPWDGLIRLHRRQQTLDLLCDQWLVLHRLEPDNQLLREKLTEALHRAGRYEEAASLMADY